MSDEDEAVSRRDHCAHEWYEPSPVKVELREGEAARVLCDRWCPRCRTVEITLMGHVEGPISIGFM